MMVVVSYDVSTKTTVGKKRLKKVAETCLNYGVRVQSSVFECLVEPAQWEMLKHKLLQIYNEEEDSLRFYFLGSNYQNRIESFGRKKNFDLDDVLLI
jgi:CRISPR-associated protein Cas2